MRWNKLVNIAELMRIMADRISNGLQLLAGGNQGPKMLNSKDALNHIEREDSIRTRVYVKDKADGGMRVYVILIQILSRGWKPKDWCNICESKQESCSSRFARD
jgi:hypothetical protein